MLIMLESLKYSFRNPKNIIWIIYRIKQLRNYKKTMGSSEDPSLINNVDELGLVYWGLKDFVKLLRKYDTSVPPLYIHTWFCGKPLSLNWITRRLWLLLAVMYLYAEGNFYIMHTVLNQSKAETEMLLHFSCLLFIQGESCWLD